MTAEPSVPQRARAVAHRAVTEGTNLRYLELLRQETYALADYAEELERCGTVTDDWTVDPETGRSNSSQRFNELCVEVERLIRGDAHALIGGRADKTAGLIMAQLAHVHGLAPRG